MLQTAPTTGIPMCQIAAADYEPPMSALGYEQKSQSAPRDGEFGAESRLPSYHVDFSTDFDCSAPESRRGTSSRYSSARDPLQTFHE